MAKHALTNAGIYFSGHDFSGDMNAVQLQLGADAQEVTAFGHTARNFVPGLLSSVFSASGYFEAASPDATLAGNLAVGGDVLILAQDASVGSVAWMMQALLHEYKLLGQVGQAAPFDLAIAAEDAAMRGQVEVLSTLSTSTASTGVQLGALSSAQRLWAAAMTTGAPGGSTPTLDLKVQSDDNGSFTSATDRITFSQMTTRSQEMASVDGAVSDDYWRFSWTVGGSTPTFPMIAAFGIVTI